MASGRQVRVGLALSGGGARGPAHIGVITTLVRAGIPIDCVAGSSVGALMGAAYCAGIPVDTLWELALRSSWRNLARPTRPTRPHGGFISFARMERWVEKLLNHATFQDLRIPLAIITTDLRTGQPVIFREGPVAPAVRASCSVPSVVTPLKLKNWLLADGCMSSCLPATLVREMGADYVIGVNISDPPLEGSRHSASAVAVLMQASQRELDGTDCLIAPQLSEFGYVRFTRLPLMLARGVQAAEAMLPEIKRALQL